MAEALVITPVKDSLTYTLRTIDAIKKSDIGVLHRIYNDFSSAETKSALEASSTERGFELIHLEDLTDHPSPNYRLVLQHAQQYALELGLPLIIVESDVEVKPDTFSSMLHFYKSHDRIGLLAAVTVDEHDEVNFPYLRFGKQELSSKYTETRKSLSFCCTLISNEFLQQYDLINLDSSKDWFDTFISDQTVRLGFRNILLPNTRVLHNPHGSRPWKHLKYKNPLKYYFLKLFKNRDKI